MISGNTEKVSRKGELAPQDPDVDLEYQNFLLKDLKPEDFVMETPLAAYFTLVIGKMMFRFCDEKRVTVTCKIFRENN